MDVSDRSALAELTEAACVEDLVTLADPQSQAQLGLTCRRIGGGLAVRMSAAPGIAYFTRAFALGISEPLTQDVLDEALDFLREAGGPVLPVQLAPAVETPEILELLSRRGLVRGSTWAKMMREIAPVPEVATDLRIQRVGADGATALGRVLIEGMEMPEFMVPWAAAQATSPGWAGYGAFDGEEVVAAGMLFVRDGVAQLAGAATLPSHRGRGAQLALMSARIADAARLGVRWVTAETGSETPGNPNPSLHNMVRAGLELLYHRQNWLLRLDG